MTSAQIIWIAGIEIFDKDSQDTHAGGSGCGCSAITFGSYILQKSERGKMEESTIYTYGRITFPGKF